MTAAIVLAILGTAVLCFLLGGAAAILCVRVYVSRVDKALEEETDMREHHEYLARVRAEQLKALLVAAVTAPGAEVAVCSGDVS